MAYSAIDKSSSFMNTVLYTGNGSTQTISGVGFQPDMTWIKDRSDTEYHRVYDSVRGATKEIYPNADLAEGTNANSLTSWNSDGFAVGTETGVNTNADLFASWNWKAGTTSGLSGGTITPSAYSFNATSGVGVYKFTGTGANATIPHGLGVAPKFIIVKNLDTVEDWFCYHSGIATDAETDYINLNNTSAAADNATMWNDTAPTSTVFSVGTANGVNKSGDNIMAYCFADVKGYSKMGSYFGNANVDGTFVYTGFKPSFVLTKPSTYASNWVLSDNKRAGFNPYSVASDLSLQPNTTNGTITEARMELYSNGFKLNSTAGETNAAYQYVYMAFGQTLVGTNGVVATAR
jgi:hypothetical protein